VVPVGRGENSRDKIGVQQYDRNVQWQDAKKTRGARLSYGLELQAREKESM